MNSLIVYEMRNTLKQFLAGVDAPAEVKRMVVSEVLQDLVKESEAEALTELKEREAKENES